MKARAKRSHQHQQSQRALQKQLAFLLMLIQRELELIAKNPILVYGRLRRVGQMWNRIKKLLTRLDLNIDKWADEHLSISRQWADKHGELDSRWPEFLEAMAWAEEIGWEPDRKPSIKAAMDLMAARGRHRSITAATRVAATAEKAASSSQTKLDLSVVDFHCGDALTVLQSLPDESVSTSVTSPPYWRHRDYDHPGQIGLEPDPEQYVAKIVAVIRELARVLAPNGTIWLVLGDVYNPSGDARKNLMLMPARVALAVMADAGLTLRAEIVLDKSTVRPDSVVDRPTRSHDMLYLLAKSASYFYKGDAIKEPLKYAPNYPGRPPRQGIVDRQKQTDYLRRWGNPSGRNARTVWRIAPKPYHGAHPATFPVGLAERCLRATLPPDGVAIDPFAGAGTTAIAALQLGASKAILIDINENYLNEARTRIANIAASPIPPPSGPLILNPSVTLYRGDCRDVLPLLPDGSFDIVVADPPYWLRLPDRATLTDFYRQNNGRKPRVRVLWDRFYSVDDYLDFTEEWLRHSVRLLHPKGSLFVFANQHNLGFINYTFQRLGIRLVNHVVWYKPNSEPHLSCRRLAYKHETIVWGVKSDSYRFNYKAVKAIAYRDKKADIQANDVWTIPHVLSNEVVGHPTQKPLAVYERLLDMCGIRGGMLLDPMCGSAPSAIAASRWGMRSVLIEREAEYIEMIKRRVANDNEKTGGGRSRG